MTYQRPTRAAALKVRCPRCDALPGLRCVGADGTEREALHQDRYETSSSVPTREHRSYDNEPPRERRPDWCRCHTDSAVVYLCDDHRRIGLEAIAAIKAKRTA